MRALIVAVVLAASTACTPSEKPLPIDRSLLTYEPYRIPYPFETGVRPGNGWSTKAQRKASGNCVVADTAIDDGETEIFRFTRVMDSNSLYSAMGIDVKARASNVMGGSLSAKASYAETRKLETAKTYVVMTGQARHGAEYLTATGPEPGDADGAKLSGIRLTDAATVLLQKSPREFEKECGDGFVASVIRGGDSARAL